MQWQQKHSIWIGIFVVFVITVYSFFWQLGYSVYNGDQLIYFPSLLHTLNPQVLGNDIAASFSPQSYTLFDELIVALVKISGLDIFTVLFILTFITRFVFFFSLYRISFFFTKNHVFSLFALLLFIVGFKVYGTGMRTIASMLLARDMATAFSLLSLALLFNKRWLFSSLAQGIGIILHPAISTPFILILYIVTFFHFVRRDILTPTFFLSAIIPIVSAIALLFFVPPDSQSGLWGLIDSGWKEILMRRESYIFVTTWYYPNSSPLYIFVGIYFFILLLRELNFIFNDPEKRKYFYLLFFVPPIMTLISLLTVDLLNISFFMQLQLGRSLMIWKLILNLLFTYYAYLYIRSNKNDVLYNFALLGIVLSFVVSEKVMLAFLPLQIFFWIKMRTGWFETLSLYRYSNQIMAFAIFLIGIPILIYFALLHKTGGFLENLPFIAVFAMFSAIAIKYIRVDTFYRLISLKILLAFLIIFTLINFSNFSISPSEMSSKEFKEVCEWVKNNTNVDANFLTEPFSVRGGSFRLLCLRNVFATKKDGGAAMFNRDFALEWRKRYDLVSKIKSDPNTINQIVKEYEVNYLLSDKRLETNYSMLFNNNNYFIYKLR